MKKISQVGVGVLRLIFKQSVDEFPKGTFSDSPIYLIIVIFFWRRE
jgi:hypothetical protein